MWSRLKVCLLMLSLGVCMCGELRKRPSWRIGRNLDYPELESDRNGDDMLTVEEEKKPSWKIGRDVDDDADDLMAAKIKQLQQLKHVLQLIQLHENTN